MSGYLKTYTLCQVRKALGMEIHYPNTIQKVLCWKIRCNFVILEVEALIRFPPPPPFWEKP